MKGLFIAIPSADGHASLGTSASAFSTAQEASAIGISTVIEYSQGALIYNARRSLLARALQLKSDFLLFLDADQILRTGAIGSLLSAMKAGRYDLVSGLTSTRSLKSPRLPISWTNVHGHMDDPPENVDLRNDIVQVQGFGLACVLMDLKRLMFILDKQLGLHGDRKADNPFLPEADEETGDVFSEDLAFCRRIKRGGARIAVHCGVWVDHLVQFPLNPAHAIDSMATRKKTKAV